jgi:hypothetical protein
MLVGLLISGIGGHWLILQPVAWAGMIVSYSREGGWRAALSRTFDGRHPCELCKVVQEGTKNQAKNSLPTPELKPDAWMTRSGAWLFPPPFLAVVPSEYLLPPLFPSSPPSPPPRSA